MKKTGLYKGKKIHPVKDVLDKIRTALTTGGNLSLIRLASGEAFTLAHGVLLPLNRIPWWVEYAGVKLPNEPARQALLTALRTADIVGLSTDRKHWESAPLLEQALSYFRVEPYWLTDSTINWHLHYYDRLYRLLGKEPTVLVGRLAPAAAGRLRRKGVNVVGTVPLEGFTDLPRAEETLLIGVFFRVALVAAGIPAAILCPRLAKKTGCVAIDYGHVINDLLYPGFCIKDLDREKEQWRERQKPGPGKT
ncbi:MAG: hypothetical protein GX894_04595 [Clostridia bacterium]|nr:hypothetical protein [Clostridia bacterium]